MVPSPLESLARLVALLLLARVAFVALCVALTVVALDHRFADGLLQTRPGLPTSPIWWAGMWVAGPVLSAATLARLLR